jgi:hypothetical protein
MSQGRHYILRVVGWDGEQHYIPANVTSDFSVEMMNQNDSSAGPCQSMEEAWEHHSRVTESTETDAG